MDCAAALVVESKSEAQSSNPSGRIARAAIFGGSWIEAVDFSEWIGAIDRLRNARRSGVLVAFQQRANKKGMKKRSVVTDMRDK